jgi:gliotoxin/aspirochlorine biosynthesis thioredoxin reductase
MAANTTHKARTVFEMFDSKDQKWQGQALVFATGCKDIFPAIDGYKENWPHNM